jgi:dihydropteroate synthase
MATEHYAFVTGKLAEPALRRELQSLAPALGIEFTVVVMPITVAALMTPKWIARRLQVPDAVTRVMVPGYCQGELGPIEAVVGVPVERGPIDLRQLSEHFGRQPAASDYGAYDIEILAEINHAPQLSIGEILRLARALTRDGADVIDLGCDPGGPWPEVETAVLALREEGFRVSIDSFDPREIGAAVAAGAELVLSVNSTNREAAADWGCEVVVIPDDPESAAPLDSAEATIDHLEVRGVRWRLDPILSPIGFGFAKSLGRYLEARRRWPSAEMMMGIGNLTELTDVDSAGVNVLLLAFCQELEIRSVLTTQVINWARTSVRECDLARRLVRYAVVNSTLPKHVEPGLVMLRDAKVLEHGPELLDQLARQLKDHSYRIFVEGGRVHAVSSGRHLEGTDAFDLFEQMLEHSPKPIDASHAFYLGYEMAKATTALTLGKNYRQDEALDWGMLTVAELTRRERRALRMARQRAAETQDRDEEEPCP